MNRLTYIVCGCLGFLLLWEIIDLVRFQAAMLSKGQYSDFKNYYMAGQRFLNDPATIYPFDATANLLSYNYPPLGVLLWAPFALFEYDTAFILFQLATAAAMLATVWATIQARRYILPDEAGRWTESVLFALLVITSGPAFSTFVSGQANAIVLALCCGSILLAARKQPIFGGSLLALACWVKVYPALLVVAMLGIKAQRPTAAWAILSGAIYAVAALPLLPIALHEQYFFQLLPVMGGKAVTQIYNQSLTASALRLSLPLDQWLEWRTVDVDWFIRWLNAGLLISVVTGLALTRIVRYRDAVLVMLLALAFVPLITPLGWGHAYLFAIPLVAYCAVYGEHASLRVVARGAWLLLLIPAYSSLDRVRHFGSPAIEILYSRYIIAVTAVICVAAVLAYRSAGASIRGHEAHS